VTLHGADGEAGDDALLSPMSVPEQADTDLLRRTHLAGGHDLPRLFERHGEAIGVTDVAVFLADLQQRVLVPFSGTNGPGVTVHAEALGIDSTLAGRAFQQVESVVQELDDGDRSSQRIWLPLVDGIERVGVLAVTVVASEEALAGDSVLIARLHRFASLAAELIVAKATYGDTIVRLRRASDMGLAAEMQWALLPPLTFANADVTIAAGLEPAYDVGGDCIDYAVDAGVARFAIFDGMGHGLRSALLAATAVAGYRNGRRSGHSLITTARGIDSAVDAAFEGEAFGTGLLAELDTDSGSLTWVNAGHPAPLLLREGRLVRELHAEPMLPFGLGATLGHMEDVSVGIEALEPRDVVILYSDGMVEARSPEGEFFGVDRMVDLVSRNLAAGLPAPETMRRIVRALLDHHQGQLVDDASLLIIEWRSDDQRSLVP